MGWNSSVILIEKASLDQVKNAIPDVFTVTNRLVGGEQATTSQLYPGGALGEIPKWIALWTSNTQLLMFDEFLESVSRTGRAVVCLQSSVSTIHGLLVYERGQHRRSLIRNNYETLVDVGEPIPEEAGVIWQDDESNVFEIVRHITGVDVTDSKTWENVKFAVFVL